MQEIHGPLSVCGCLKDGTLVILQDIEPVVQIAVGNPTERKRSPESPGRHDGEVPKMV